MAEYIYSAIKPRITLVSEPVLKIELKDPIFYLDKSCIIYRFNCFCDRSYIYQNSRHLKTRVKQHVLRCVEKFIEGKTNIKTAALLNATRRSSISKHLVNNPERGNNYEDIRFKIEQQCSNVYDLVKMEDFFIHLNKPELCKQKEFDYVM